MLLKKEKSCLLLVDVQEKLTPKIANVAQLLESCQRLSQLASTRQVPLLISEQYPQGLGSTLPGLATQPAISKDHFSCWREPQFQEAFLALNKQQVIIIGIETHVCVLQTALDLHAAGYEVFVVVDAVGSRHPMDNQYGLKRMKQDGVHLMTSEMVFFEWLEHAKTPEFKALSQWFFEKERAK